MKQGCYVNCDRCSNQDNCTPIEKLLCIEENMDNANEYITDDNFYVSGGTDNNAWKEMSYNKYTENVLDTEDEEEEELEELEENKYNYYNPD